jgi:hypothetical protein
MDLSDSELDLELGQCAISEAGSDFQDEGIDSDADLDSDLHPAMEHAVHDTCNVPTGRLSDLDARGLL